MRNLFLSLITVAFLFSCETESTNTEDVIDDETLIDDTPEEREEIETFDHEANILDEIDYTDFIGTWDMVGRERDSDGLNITVKCDENYNQLVITDNSLSYSFFNFNDEESNYCGEYEVVDSLLYEYTSYDNNFDIISNDGERLITLEIIRFSESSFMAIVPKFEFFSEIGPEVTFTFKKVE